MDHEHPPGYEVLEERWNAVPELMSQWLGGAESEERSGRFKGARFVITGIGSSEAHARYLQCLLAKAGEGAAEFRPISSFYLSACSQNDRDKVLVVISQGLSPNAWLAIKARHYFRQLVILTSCTADGIAQRNDPALSAAFQELVGSDTTFVRFPLENEYQVLIRLVGPLFGYLACYRFARIHAAVNLPPFSLEQLSSAYLRSEGVARTVGSVDLTEGTQGLHLIVPPMLSLYAQNLGLKFLEGLFWELPRVWDYLDVSHGLLQQLSVVSRPVWLLTRAGDELTLSKRVEEVLKGTKLSYSTLTAELPPYLEIIEFEMIFSRLILELIDRYSIDQRNWPAKGLDYPLYALGKA